MGFETPKFENEGENKESAELLAEKEKANQEKKKVLKSGKARKFIVDEKGNTKIEEGEKDHHFDKR